MPRDPGKTAKQQILRQQGVLNPHPRDVQHELFQNNDFFDPEDLVQVKYEMLRLVEIDRQSVSAAAKAFGFPRPSFYQNQTVFQQAGLAGLLPSKRGPRSGHKLTTEVMEFISRTQAADASLSHLQLAEAVRERFALRSSAQYRPAVAPSKKTVVIASANPAAFKDALVAAYEELRRQFIGPAAGPVRSLGLALLLDRGMRQWMEACADMVNTAAAPESQPSQPALLSSSVRSEMVVLLAGMALEASGRAISL